MRDNGSASLTPIYKEFIREFSYSNWRHTSFFVVINPTACSLRIRGVVNKFPD